MRLVIFDVDGTLTATTKADEECFVRSFEDVFGFVTQHFAIAFSKMPAFSSNCWVADLESR